MTKHKKATGPFAVEALKARPVPRGRPATGLRQACLYTSRVAVLIRSGWPIPKAIDQVAEEFKKRPEHVRACRKLVADEMARRKANNDPRPLYEDD
jgi:hypothetical protein